MSQALEGLTVIDMSAMLAGPSAARMLADFGATVITIEPLTGSSSRHNGWRVDGTSLWWRVLGRNKYSLAVNLKDARGVDIARRLIDEADVLVENMRPGKLEALGLAPDMLHQSNPGLVILRVTGYGQTGPYANRAAFGTQAEAHSGFAYCNGDPEGAPTLPSIPLADTAAGYLGAFSILLALWERDHGSDHRGQVIDLSLMESLFGLLGPQASVLHKLGEITTRRGNRLPTACPRNVYQARDGGWVAVSCSLDIIAHRAFSIIGRSDLVTDPEYATLDGRLRNIDKVDALMQEWIGLHDADAVIDAFAEAGAAAAKIYSIADVMADPHYTEREVVTEVETPDIGPLKMQNVFPRLSRTPGEVRWAGKSLGSDTEDILLNRLGLSPSWVEELRKDGVVAP